MSIFRIIKEWVAAVSAASCSFLKSPCSGTGSGPGSDAGDACCLELTIRRQRYSLAELLAGATPKNVDALFAETAWALEGSAVGEELA